MNAEGQETISRALGRARVYADVVTAPLNRDLPYVTIEITQELRGRDAVKAKPADVLNALADAGLLAPEGSTDVGFMGMGPGGGSNPSLKEVGVGDTTLTFRDLNARLVPEGTFETR